MAELAGDVHRYLADLPVAARPPSKFYEWRKFDRRNMGLVATLAAVLLGLAGTTIGTTVGLQRAREAEEALRNAASKRKFLLDILAVETPQPNAGAPDESDVRPDLL